MSHSVERPSGDGRFTLTVEVEGIEKLAGKYHFTAKVVRICNDSTAQDVTGSFPGRFGEQWGEDQSEAIEKAIASAEKVLGIATGETPTV